MTQFGEIAVLQLRELETSDETLEAISRRIGRHVTIRFGLELDETDLAMIVAGYALYFREKGLV